MPVAAESPSAVVQDHHRERRVLDAILPALVHPENCALGPEDWQDLDWGFFESELRRLRLPCHLQYLLTRNPDWAPDIPAGILTLLRTSYFKGLRQSLARVGVLGPFLIRAQKSRLPLIVLRGPALAETYYPDPALRPSTDVDILVRKKDLERLLESCRTRGFVIRGSPCGFKHQALHEEHPLSLDIHTDLWYEPDKSYWARALPFETGGGHCLRLGPEDMLIHLVAHTAVYHRRFSTFDALDLAFLLKKERMDWDLVAARISGSNLGGFVCLALRRTREHTGVALPESVIERFEPKGLRRLEHHLSRWIMSRTDVRSTGYFLSFLSIKGLGPKTAWLRSTLFPNNEFMALLYGKHGPWKSVMYRVLRPVHLAARAVSALVRLALGSSR